MWYVVFFFFFFQAEDGIRDHCVTGVQTCALPIWGITNWGSNYVLVKTGLQALLKLRTDIYAHLQRLSLKFHDARRSADSSFRVAYDSQSIQTRSEERRVGKECRYRWSA